MKKEEGLRFNEGKDRFDLVHPAAMRGLVKVLTLGSNKYEPRNWEKGMMWSKVVASLKRHLQEFEEGKDFDSETGLKHIDHLACNAHFLSAYYSIAPQFDDRPHLTTQTKKIGLDIDDVICSWVTEWAKLQGIPTPTCWNFDWQLQEKFLDISSRTQTLGGLNDLEEFYLGLPVKEDPCEIPFIPECYITHRPVCKELTELWLEKNGFPLKPVFQVNSRAEKLEVAKTMELDIFVDDNYDTYMMMNRGGICCYLYDALHNRRHDVGYRRIKSLKELPW
jgi:hypothetical protein